MDNPHQKICNYYLSFMTYLKYPVVEFYCLIKVKPFDIAPKGLTLILHH